MSVVRLKLRFIHNIVGVVNRGEGCAREDGLGIYARIKVCEKLFFEVDALDAPLTKIFSIT